VRPRRTEVGAAEVRDLPLIAAVGVHDPQLHAIGANEPLAQEWLAREHEPLARQIFQRAGKLLGLAAANLISLFDPEVVIVAGEMLAAADLFFPTLKETALARCQPLAAKHVQIKLSRLGADANLLGVAYMALSGGPERMKSSTSNRRSSTL